MTLVNKLIFFLLCAVIVFTALAYGTVHQPVIALFYLIVTAIAALWAIDGFQSGNFRFSKSLVQIPFVAIILYGFVQIIPFGSMAAVNVSEIPRTISLDPFATQIATLHFLALLIFLAALLAYTDSARRLQKLVLVITVFGFIYAFYAILQAVLSPNKIYGIYESRHSSPFGSFVNRHNFAAYMEMTLSLPLGLMFVGGVSRDKRLIYVTAIALMGIALLLSGSRGGLVAFLAQIILLVFLTTKTKSYGQVVLKIALAAILVAAIAFGSILIGGESSLTRIAGSADSENSATNRTQIWNVTLSVIKNNLPFGAGLGAFGVAYTPFDASGSGLERVEQAHNDYLQVLADAGIFGLVIGGFFVFWLFRAGFENLKTANTLRRGVALGALAGCFSILVHSLFDFVLHTTAVSVLFCALIAIVISGGNKYEDDFEEERPARRKKKSSGTVTSIAEKRRIAE